MPVTYHAPTGKFVLPVSDLQEVAHLFRYSIRHIRAAAGLPLEPYPQVGRLSSADHAMRGIIDAAKKLGIDMGADWGNELDVREAE